MPDQNQTPTQPTTPPATPSEIMFDVINKIQSVHNILIALSSDPSVDEIAAAIGLSLYLDRTGKRATSIYSGKTPNALEFLNPSKTFETTSDVLRDFVIALDKDKADHLRYKLDGDYVKIFITPYKSRIDEEDLEFSLGDFNIELVLALNVASGIDLDDALREHGRVMHDATVINITNGNPGKFGDIEWSDKSRSSICEIIANLLYQLGGKNALEPDEATALLSGIVSATDHFSNSSTTAESLNIGSKLMHSGADRQLISENISLDSDNMLFMGSARDNEEVGQSSIAIHHDDDETTEPENTPPAELPTAKPAATIEPTASLEPAPVESPDTAELQAIATDLANITTPDNPALSAAPAIATPDNPALSAAPAIATTPELNNIPSIDYSADPGNVLPPAPTPPIDLNSPMPSADFTAPPSPFLTPNP